MDEINSSEEEIVERMTVEDLYKGFCYTPIILDEFDKDEFDGGVKDASYWVGFYAALINAGMPNSQASEFIVHVLNSNKESLLASSKII